MHTPRSHEVIAILNGDVRRPVLTPNNPTSPMTCRLERRRPRAPNHTRGRNPSGRSIDDQCVGSQPRHRRAPVRRIGRGLLRQRHVRKLLRHPRMRAARPPQAPLSRRSADGHLRVHRGVVHRGVVQPPTAPLRHRISFTGQLRTEQATRRSHKSMTVHKIPATPESAGIGSGHGLMLRLRRMVCVWLCSGVSWSCCCRGGGVLGRSSRSRPRMLARIRRARSGFSLSWMP